MRINWTRSGKWFVTYPVGVERVPPCCVFLSLVTLSSMNLKRDIFRRMGSSPNGETKTNEA